MNTKSPELPAFSSAVSLDVIGSALELLHTCEMDVSSSNILENELQELARKFVTECDELGLVPVADISELDDLPF